jgi:hypothetical protein
MFLLHPCKVSTPVANPIKLFLPVNFTSEFSSEFYEEKITRKNEKSNPINITRKFSGGISSGIYK